MSWLRTSRKKILFVGQILLAAILIVIIFKKIDASSIFDALRHTSVPGIAGLIVLSLLIKYLYAFQMHAMLSTQGIKLNVHDIFKTYLIVSFYSYIVPSDIAAGGITWAKLGKKSNSWAHSGFTIIYMRIINLLLLLIIGMAGSLLDPSFRIVHIRPIIVVGIIICCSALLPFYSRSAAGWMEKIFTMFTAFGPHNQKLALLIKNLVHTIREYPSNSRKRFFTILFLGLLIQSVNIIFLLCAGKVMALDVPFFVMIWLWPVLTIFGLLPFAFGGLGVREGLMVVLLAPYSATSAERVAFSLLLYSIAFISSGLLGGWFEAQDVFFSKKKTTGISAGTTK